MQIQIVKFEEIVQCPINRLDAEHYIPIHRTWECLHGSELRSKAQLVAAWIEGKITSKQFKLGMKYVQ